LQVEQANNNLFVPFNKAPVVQNNTQNKVSLSIVILENLSLNILIFPITKIKVCLLDNTQRKGKFLMVFAVLVNNKNSKLYVYVFSTELNKTTIIQVLGRHFYLNKTKV
jgi:hypothetical protein